MAVEAQLTCGVWWVTENQNSKWFEDLAMGSNSEDYIFYSCLLDLLNNEDYIFYSCLLDLLIM
jgi:hypothetical protein